MTSAGAPLPDLEEIDVWRVEIPAGQEPSLADTARDRQARSSLLKGRGEIIRKLLGDSLDRATRGAALEIEEDLSPWLAAEGEKAPILWYAVVSICCSGRQSEFSTIARIQPMPPPEAPEGVVATPEADGIHLSWEKPTIGKIVIERSADSSTWTALEITSSSENSWVDSGASQGGTWFYRARVKIHQTAGAVHLGLPGETLEIDYPDIYPPAPPTELFCLPELSKVRLRWLASADPATYKIEREDSRRTRKILAGNHSELSLIDDAAPMGPVIYRVWAVDAAGNTSEPAECRVISGRSP